ncbi:acetylglutamate kinase [Bacillus sp. FJAT-27225]|uniref:acetylglutamate kinase n=1 Tax=Bacillus sp. FJAT-27225 TaxID=1743144 RepID=UPI00080C312C|nr:acetylglutamate kinase [Bacillus sp. FJAT-27225]OCA83309.1 acetylglutamate kinase [Bacillus sp. FJAT-27225]
MEYVVIKCGGSIMEKMPPALFENIVSLAKSGQWSPILVHGGGPLITSMLEKLKIESRFVGGLRVTSNEVLDVVEMALSGIANKQIVRKIALAGGKAIGISGTDGGLLTAKPAGTSDVLGFVGDVTDVNTSVLTHLIGGGYIPVVSPIGCDQQGQRYNINGDTAAAAIASALGGKLCFISDIPGILIDKNGGEKSKLDTATKSDIDEMIASGQIWGGMIPKVRSALNALLAGVGETVIINGLEPGSLLAYCKGENAGTKIVLEKEAIHGIQ